MRLDHYTIRTTRLEETVRFYEDVIGLKSGFRPRLPMNGAWLYAGETPSLHLMELPAADIPTGPLDHVALALSGLEAFVERADRAGLPRVTRRIPETPIIQVQLLDPNGVMVEANFSDEAFTGPTDTLDFDAHARLAELRLERGRSTGMARAGDVETAYETCGAGPFLIFLHGGDADRGSFAPVLPALAKRFTCVTYDQRDTGGTRNPNTTYKIAHLADDAAALITHLGGRAHVWGASFGGSIGQELALRHPDLVDGLVLSVTYQNLGADLADPEGQQRLRERAATDPAARDELAARFFSPSAVTRRPELVKSLLAALKTRPAAAAARRMQAAREFDSVGRARAIAARTLVVGAMEDRIIDPGASWRLAREIPNATLTMLGGVGHALVFEDPSRVAALVAVHLQAAAS